MITKLITGILLLGIFALGVLTGSYYHNEINVLWGHAFEEPSYKVASEVVIPAKEFQEKDSIINLPNLEESLPLVYSDTLEEDIIQEYLKEGAVVLPLGTFFGEEGNVVVTAHSSGTLSFGPYRQAFARLAELEEGDEFTVQDEKAVYTYKVYDKEVVWPHEVDKLPQDDRSTVTLVTCWPLWTNFKRLLVHSELIEVNDHIKENIKDI